MSASFIDRLDIANYGCVRQAGIRVTAIHALIGPNDSGKSTVLRALRTVAQFAGGQFEGRQPFDPQLAPGVSGTTIAVGFSDGLRYAVSTTPEGTAESAERSGRNVAAAERRGWNALGILHTRDDGDLPTLRERLPTATALRLDPDALRRPTGQIVGNQAIAFFDERGEGLAAVYQAISSQRVDAFIELRDAARALFPTLRTLRTVLLQQNLVALQAELTSGNIVPADAMSEGLLYFLAFAAIPYLRPTKLFLIEEPENGLHPARVGEVMRMLREVSRTAQVVIATHSPFVVNALEGDEVSVLTRTEADGTKATLLKDTPNYEERRRIYVPGELWVSYADGKLEEPLFRTPAQAEDAGEPIDWLEPTKPEGD